MEYIFMFVIVTMLFSVPCFIDGAPSPLIEMSYTFDDNTPSYPFHTKFTSKVVVNGTEPYGVWVAVNDICSSEHSGTHMDAPLHMIQNGIAVDVIPFEKLYRVAGVKVDVTKQAKMNRNYPISAQDMDDWVSAHGELPDGVVVLFETGWGKKANDPVAYSGIDENKKLNHPGIGKDAAQWMVDYRNKTGQKHGVIGVGLDSLSLDIGSPQVIDAHLILLRKDMIGLENLKNLDLLPARDFTLTMLPMKIGKGTGGPTRVLAELDGVPFYARALAEKSTGEKMEQESMGLSNSGVEDHRSTGIQIALLVASIIYCS